MTDAKYHILSELAMRPLGMTQINLARLIDCSDTQVRRLLSELHQSGFIFPAGGVYTGRRPRKFWRIYLEGVNALNEECRRRRDVRKRAATTKRAAP